MSSVDGLRVPANGGVLVQSARGFSSALRAQNVRTMSSSDAALGAESLSAVSKVRPAMGKVGASFWQSPPPNHIPYLYPGEGEKLVRLSTLFLAKNVLRLATLGRGGV